MAKSKSGGQRGLPQLGLLKAANCPPVSVSREATIERARTLMLIYDFSQLPVMSGERSVHGMVSWKSLGRASARSKSGKRVVDFMEEKPPVLLNTTPLLEAIEEIVRHEIVLVTARDRTITGLVTTTDLSAEMRRLSEAFLLLGEIEEHIRRIIGRARFTVDELKAVLSPESARQVHGVRDLSFGEYLRLLAHPSNWTRTRLRIDRSETIATLQEVREIRNAVMHFRSEPQAEAELDKLRRTADFLRHL